MSDVVITGFGATTPLGPDAPTTWQGLLEGRNGVHTLDFDWMDDVPVKFAASAVDEPTNHIPRPQARRLDRSSQLALVAAKEAWADADLKLPEPGDDTGDSNGIDPERLVVCCATGIGGLHSLLGQWDIQKDKGFKRVSPFTVPMLMANAPAANIGLLVHAKAGVHTPVSACASSSEAISLGLDQIRLGRADIAVVGGAEAIIHPLPVAAFAQMKALSTRNDDPEHASRPWDVDRDGFVIGEGAAIMVIETEEHAKARGAKVYGTLAGSGISADSHDIVQPDPTGSGQASAMRKALHSAGLSPSDVNHVNAHATSTPLGDTAEAHSIASVLGDATDQVLVTGTKSMTGHLLGGAGALESFASVMALLDHRVPGTININQLEEGLKVNIVTRTTDLPVGDLVALNNSFGFGGHNVTLAFTNANATR